MSASNLLLLRPRSFGELLDQAIRLYRNNFFKFVGIIAIIEVPLVILQLIVSVLTVGPAMQTVLDPTQIDESALPGMLGQMMAGAGASMVVGVVSFVLIQCVATAALTRAIADTYLGEETGIEQAYSKVGKIWGGLLAALLLAGLFGIPLVIWLVIPCIGWFTGPGMLFYLSLAIVPLLAPIVILERRASLNALERAWFLSRPRFWWLVIFVTILFLFNLLVVTGPVSLLSAFFQSLIVNAIDNGNPANLFLIQSISQSLLSLVLGLLYHPLQSTCITLAYFDLRVRQEGFDLALLANAAGDAPLSAVEMAAQAPVAQPKGLLSWADMGNFALLSFLAMAVYLIPVSILMAISGLITGLSAGM